MQEIKIIKAEPTDIHRLQSIARQTFIETFSDHNTEEDMQKYLAENITAEKLTAEINNPNSQFYFAVHENTVIGYLKLNSGQSQTELKDDKAIEIERIYVLKEYHGKEVGKILYNHALNIARQSEAEYIWLGVWEKNTRAISFYKKNGFIEFDKHLFILGNDAQTDIMMKRKVGD